MDVLLEFFSVPLFTLGAFFTASLFLMLASGRAMIVWLKGLQDVKWSPREDTPDFHLQKAGVPSMGGIGLIGTALLGYAAVMVFSALTEGILFNNYLGDLTGLVISLLLFPAVIGAHAVLGLVDDWSKARGRGGLSSKAKLLGQVLLAFLFLKLSPLPISSLRYHAGATEWGNFLQSLVILLAIVGTSNAVNLTDGIDGLAAGLSVQCAAAFTIVLLWPSPGALNLDYTPTVLFSWLCLGGSCLGFLKFNRYPASVFMGDTGSLALGAALGAGAVLTHTIWLLPFVGFIFFVEMFSVIIQVLFFKYTRKVSGQGGRIFRRVPLHHHFELGGWTEWRVVGTFWTVNLCTSVLGLVLWKMGVLPHFP